MEDCELIEERQNINHNIRTMIRGIKGQMTRPRIKKEGRRCSELTNLALDGPKKRYHIRAQEI